MTPTQIDFLRDFAIANLPRAKSDREQTNRFGGSLYEKLAYSSVMVRGRAGTTATEYAAANVLESVCLLQHPLPAKERSNTLHNLTSAAHTLCFHTGQLIEWLDDVPPEPEPPAPPVVRPLPPIAGRWLTTKEAASVMGNKEQTLRQWSSNQSGPISPTKVGRSLRWSGDDILTVLIGPVCVRASKI